MGKRALHRRYGRSGLPLTVAALVALAALAPAAARGQEEEEPERPEAPDARVRIVQGPGLFLGAGGFLGVRLSEVDAETVERLGLPEERGALVREVLEETPAAEAGLEADDVLVSWNGARVESAAQLSRLARETPPGRTVRLGVLRDGSERAVSVELGEPAARWRGPGVAPGAGVRGAPGLRGRALGEAGRALALAIGRPRLGVAVSSLTDQLGEYFGAEGGEGALITRVVAESPAGRAGLRAGDVILSVAGEDVDRPGDISRALRGRDAGPVEVRILRDRQERTVTVELEEPEEVGGEGAFLLPEVPSFDFHVEPMPPVPAMTAPAVEVQVRGLEEALESVDWDAFARQWEAWGEEWGEQWERWSDEWSRAWEQWGRQWEGQNLEGSPSPLEVIRLERGTAPVFL